MAETTEGTIELTALQISNMFKFNSNTRQYISKKYKSKTFTLKEWKNKLKNDGLDF
jgi:hypothetical protein